MAATPAGSLDPASLFSRADHICLEIGFGGGEHLIGQARANPDTGYIGAEPFIDGMAKALTGIVEHGLENVRLHMDDARVLIGWLAPGSIGQVFILFPDPWPKARHNKRRLVQPDFLDELARILTPGAHVRFATDMRAYADHTLTVFLKDGRFDWQAERSSDWTDPPADHIRTRYEAKHLGDIDPVWFDFRFSEN